MFDLLYTLFKLEPKRSYFSFFISRKHPDIKQGFPPELYQLIHVAKSSTIICVENFCKKGVHFRNARSKTY